MSSESDAPSSEHSYAPEHSHEGQKTQLEVEFTGGGPLSIQLSTDNVILNEARRLALRRDSSLNDFATCVSQDPIIVLELLKVANATIVNQDRPPITLAKNAVIQLGMARVIEILDALAARPVPEKVDVHHELEKLRSRARRSSILARILAMTHHRDLAPEAQTIGLMVELGHMLSCVYFGSSYAQLVHQISRGTLNYRLQHDQHFDLKKIQLSFLRRAGFPEALLFALDRETPCKTPHRIAMRHIVESASEMVEAFDNSKWHKFEPGKNLPVNSSIRLLRLDDTQYQRVWERCNEYLRLAQEEERIRIATLNGELQSADSPEAQTSDHRAPETLEDVPTTAKPETVGTTVDAPEPDEDSLTNNAASEPDSKPTHAFTSLNLGRPAQPQTQRQSPTKASATPNANSTKEEKFDQLLFPPTPPPEFALDATPKAKPQLNSKQAQVALSALCELCESIENTSDLLEEIMTTLTAEGPFVRAALFVLSENRRSAAVLRAVGNDIADGAEVAFTDPTNPLAICMQQVRSFNANGTKDITAPLGISSYAVAPINVRHDTPVFLYADCGSDKSMTFEARKLFRYVVGLLNSTLPNIEGELPQAR